MRKGNHKSAGENVCESRKAEQKWKVFDDKKSMIPSVG